MRDTIYLHELTDPYEGADFEETVNDRTETVGDDAYCPLCGMGSQKNNVKICDECKDVI
jgi:hypothetical protein